ncbi:hypothetical protein BH10BAC3_BH10BAC3_09290 [soil metagenome]
MHNDLLDILSNKTLPISNEQLVNYLTGKLTEQERYDIEKTIINSGVDNEALEGLQLVADKAKILQYQLEINKKLKEKLQQKKPKRRRGKNLQPSYILILTGALLAFIILLWLILHLIQSSH